MQQQQHRLMDTAATAIMGHGGPTCPLAGWGIISKMEGPHAAELAHCSIMPVSQQSRCQVRQISCLLTLPPCTKLKGTNRCNQPNTMSFFVYKSSSAKLLNLPAGSPPPSIALRH
jgi:hypothetical protein